ncbi:16S rRNA (uracil(1498)-N(3))-methyltransferase [Algoriphagus halophytocola]|uniref:Ribosomal RNA small subunit methyltransferase E n=1 Tax=Algoriphagus halophytocola TaxID=2991499 RepID=A0ABY6MKQ2_9BACT|nr:16S rRNA (uracil(1498)-N(3))-methyltransferase [Algoriphagus sp. TR-M5]UZD23680.1 16S rRNA (uracil(1498)-N(3))-methyltransferase [Algoriphagus sp. TR-M5]
MQLFFQENINTPTFDLEPDESKHLCRVLRKKNGDQVFVTDGNGQLFECMIIDANPKRTSLEVRRHHEVPADSFHIHLAIAPTKSPDRMEWMVEKITEIGVHEITLFESTNSERSYLKTDRLEKKIKSACKQSLKYRVPTLNPIRKLSEILESAEFNEGQKFIAYVDENHDNHLLDLAEPNSSYLILIGPEGDFDEKEINTAIENGFKPISLGKSRLRTETAGLSAVQMLQTLNR